MIPQDPLLVIIGLALLGFAGYKIASRFRHPRWVGMRVRSHELMLWSFLMATAHGAGLMIVPVLAGMRGEVVPSVMAGSERAEHMASMMPTDHTASRQVASGTQARGSAFAAVVLHSFSMLAVTSLIALVVFRKVGVDVLRRAWTNLDFIWVGAFMVAGVVTLSLGLWPLLSN